MMEAIHFDRAPLEEVVCGVRFDGVQWADIYFGLFYAEIRDRYKETRRRTPLPPSVFDPSSLGEMQLTLMPEPTPPLLWFESPDSPFLLQVQQDAFLVNWRRQSGKFDYPHFRTRQEGVEGVWDRFSHEWKVFCSFCENQNIGTPRVLSCHLAYIDHLIQGEGWESPHNLARWFHLLAGLKPLGSLSSFNVAVKYQLNRLPLMISIHPAIRTNDRKNLFVIEFIITAQLSAESTLESWFESAHEMIIQQFVAHTTGEAHKEWGRTDG